MATCAETIFRNGLTFEAGSTLYLVDLRDHYVSFLITRLCCQCDVPSEAGSTRDKSCLAMN